MKLTYYVTHKTDETYLLIANETIMMSQIDATDVADVAGVIPSFNASEMDSPLLFLE